MAEKKSKQMLCRATPSEKATIEERASKHGFSSVSRYMVETAVEGVVMPAVEGAASAEERELIGLQEEVKKVARQVERAGVNLNQVCRRINSQRAYEIVPAQQLRAAADQVNHTAELAAQMFGGLQEQIDEARQREKRRRRRQAADRRIGEGLQS